MPAMDCLAFCGRDSDRLLHPFPLLLSPCLCRGTPRNPVQASFTNQRQYPGMLSQSPGDSMTITGSVVSATTSRQPALVTKIAKSASNYRRGYA